MLRTSFSVLYPPAAVLLIVDLCIVFIGHKVFHWTHEMPPDQKRPLDTYYDGDRGRLASYQLEVSHLNKHLNT